MSAARAGRDRTSPRSPTRWPLEAFQNISKYANASRATVRLSVADDELRFEVEDDGSGFDQASTNAGSGIQGMADRLDALGGSLRVESRPGQGTKITGRVPARPLSSTSS